MAKKKYEKPQEVIEQPEIKVEKKMEVKRAVELSIAELKMYIEVIAKEQYDCLNLLIKKLHEAGKPTQRYIKIKNNLYRVITKTLCKD